jgi:hypothetical protein
MTALAAETKAVVTASRPVDQRLNQNDVVTIVGVDTEIQADPRLGAFSPGRVYVALAYREGHGDFVVWVHESELAKIS